MAFNKDIIPNNIYEHHNTYHPLNAGADLYPYLYLASYFYNLSEEQDFKRIIDNSLSLKVDGKLVIIDNRRIVEDKNKFETSEYLRDNLIILCTELNQYCNETKQLLLNLYEEKAPAFARERRDEHHSLCQLVSYLSCFCHRTSVNAK